MAVNIVTGMTGKAHITSDDDRARNAMSFGIEKYVMDFGKKFETLILSNNQVRIYDGMCINQGTQMGIELTDYEDVTIENGVSGSNRNDLIVMRYERNLDTSMENASLVVIKGRAGITATDPPYTSGNILDGGDLIDDMPLFRVKIESLTITKVEPLFVVFTEDKRKNLLGLSNVDNTSDLNKPISTKTQEALDKIAGKVVIGTLSAGNTSVTLNDPAIKDSSTVDFYTSIYGVSPTSVLIAEGRITLDFEAQESDMNVKVVIS